VASVKLPASSGRTSTFSSRLIFSWWYNYSCLAQIRAKGDGGYPLRATHRDTGARVHHDRVPDAFGDECGYCCSTKGEMCRLY
jgi:hypothetical protein